jgi:prevent-host-death family protein
MPERSIGETRAQLAELLSQAFYHGARTIITKRGRPIAALISIHDLKRFEELEARDDLEDALAASGDTVPTDGIPLEQVIAEVQAKRKPHRTS